jgi:hypothetical protein
MTPADEFTPYPSPQPDRYIPILLLEALLLATGALYYFWTVAT